MAWFMTAYLSRRGGASKKYDSCIKTPPEGDTGAADHDDWPEVYPCQCGSVKSAPG